MSAIDPEFCNCGVPISDTSLAHYLSCGDDGMDGEEARWVQDTLSSWADRELRAMDGEDA